MVLHGFFSKDKGQNIEQWEHKESRDRAWFNNDEWKVCVLSKGTVRGEAAIAMIDLLLNSSLSSSAKQLARPPNPLSQSTRRWKPWRWSHSSAKKWSLSSKSSWNWDQVWWPHKMITMQSCDSYRPVSFPKLAFQKGRDQIHHHRYNKYCCTCYIFNKYLTTGRNYHYSLVVEVSRHHENRLWMKMQSLKIWPHFYAWLQIILPTFHLLNEIICDIITMIMPC